MVSVKLMSNIAESIVAVYVSVYCCMRSNVSDSEEDPIPRSKSCCSCTLSTLNESIIVSPGNPAA